VAKRFDPHNPLALIEEMALIFWHVMPLNLVAAGFGYFFLRLRWSALSSGAMRINTQTLSGPRPCMDG
jgi:hypothetical protein